MAVEVIIADDHSMVREGLKQLLELDGDIVVIGEASDGVECLDLLEKNLPQALLLDINMPNMNGLEVLEKIKEKKLDTKVIILTVHNEVEYLLKAVEIGIDGYMLKDSNSDELKKAIYSVIDGESYIQPNLIPILNSKMIERDVEKEKLALLTKRELEVLKLMAVGSYNKEIGEKLNISERTVKNHISSIFKKIDVSDRTQAAIFAIRNNLISIF
ncbi:response regulator [Roseburia sp. MSJ-14]|uniref:response regulator n=1 Tax=Roseburia sp. MSJ-14 TaxID=2841514 RepID=UPI001C109C32|nr:response regulator transcription factor [Roseburia sp. MSJ-14]MBU5474203.1 response regulator transcription factor [Roseburia sp. MSJ-14]